jgi:hypothetical protein
MTGRGQVYVPFRLSDLREIKEDMGSYTDAPDWYIQAFISVIQTFKLAWKDIVLLLGQNLSSLVSRPRSLRLEMITIYNKPQYLWHPKMRE